MSKLLVRYLAAAIGAIISFAASLYFELVTVGELSGPIQVSEKVLDALETFTRDLGFALIIALVISIGIEAHARAEDRKLAEKMRELIALDVFKGVFSNKLEKSYVDRVVELHLYPTVVREDFIMRLTLESVTRDGLLEFGMPENRYAILRSEYEFLLKNTSTGAVNHDFKVTIPRRGGPWDHLNQLHWMRIGDESLSVNELKIIATESAETSYMKTIPLGPGEVIRIAVTTEVLKEVSDAEVWSSFLPTMTTVIAFRNLLEGTISGVRSTGPAPALLAEPWREHHRMWELRQPLLRGESIVFWWRTLEELEDQAE